MPQLSIEQQRAVAVAAARLRLQQQQAPAASHGATGSWAEPEKPPWTSADLPTPLRVPLEGLAQFGKGATNVLRMPLDLAKAGYDAFTTNPIDVTPEEAPAYGLYGPAGLLVHRLAIQPQLEQARKAKEESQRTGPPMTLRVPTPQGHLPIPIPQNTAAVGHALAAAIPFLGPWAAHLGETIGEGRPAEAVGEAATAAVLPGVVKEAKTAARMAPVRKGYTTLDYSTMEPLAPEAAILVKHGLPTPEIPKGKIAQYERPTNQIARGLGLADDVEGIAKRDAIADVYPDLKYAQQHAEGVRGPVNTPAKFRALLDWSNNRIWSKVLEPEIRQSGPMRNLATLSEDVQAQLPEHVQAFYGEMVKAKLDPIQEVVNRYKKPGEAIPEVDPMLMHGLAKAIRTELDLAATAMEQGIQRQMPKGEILYELNAVLRDKLYEHVQMRRGVDLRTAARKYGRTADIKGQVADLTTPKGFFETLFSSYTFPTGRAIAARIGETAGKQMVNNLKELKRGFDVKMTPEEEALVTRPAPPKGKPPSSVGPQPKRGASIGPTAEPGLMAPTPPPGGPTARLIDWTGKTPKLETAWPAPTKPGVDRPLVSPPALPSEDFHLGKTGIVAEGPEGAKQVRDYSKQKQLFAIEQTPPPRWRPTERATSTMKDLREMRDEIVRYLARGNPDAATRQEYIADVKAIQAEITRRQQARRAGPTP